MTTIEGGKQYVCKGTNEKQAQELANKQSLRDRLNSCTNIKCKVS